jgi:hypothetical protein
MSKKYRHPHGEFVLTLPGHWDYSELKSTVAFFQVEGGVGAMNISVLHRNESVLDPSSVILEFAPKPIRSNLEVTSLQGNVPGAYAAYRFKEKAWRLWVIFAPSRILVASYNCDLKYKGAEDPVVDTIIQSVEIN